MGEKSESVTHLDSKNFGDVIKREKKPVLVDFWAAWCGPCRTMAPVMEALARDYSGRAVVTKVNVDQNASVASKYGITLIPTFMIFKDGQQVETIVGAVGHAPLEEALKRYL